MKLLIIWLWSFIACSVVFGQERQTAEIRKAEAEQAQELGFSIDERGKYVYYEVVTQKGKTEEELKKNAQAYFKNLKSAKMLLSEKDSVLSGKGKLILNKTAFVLTRPSGEVRYQLYLDFKDGKYRFWLTDFSFIPYQRDRYGNFVPSTPIGSPLELKPGKLNAAEWEFYLKATAREALLFGEELKKGMLLDAAIIVPAAKVAPVQRTKDQKW
ncbi:DUF4468 domain-containing protein [Pedobacter gandavensis]|uniref:DUF4468 domain-containing protein n=1 Tax=Pedobacter gandavensis TaxID=2679963 RepID=UPI00292CD826|nr:DUF4468 domain-containing protein [Pedobacter gandavensis]